MYRLVVNLNRVHVLPLAFVRMRVQKDQVVGVGLGVLGLLSGYEGCC